MRVKFTIFFKLEICELPISTLAYSIDFKRAGPFCYGLCFPLDLPRLNQFGKRPKYQWILV